MKTMKCFHLFNWLTLAAVVVGTSSRPAYCQTQITQLTDQANVSASVPQQQEIAKADFAALAAFAAVAPTTSVASNSAPVPPPPSSFTWTGFYAGVNIGRGSADATASENPLPTAAIFINLLPQTFKLDPSGALGGGQIGYNKQFGHFVIGVEADIDAAGLDATVRQSPIVQNNGTPFPGTGNNIILHQRTDAISTIRPRFGFAAGHFLLYGTGGLAIAHVGYTANTDFHPVGTEQYPANFSKTQKGWAAGGGAEVAIGGGFSVKGEYLRYDVGSQSFIANPDPPFPPTAPRFQIAYTWNTSSANFFRFGVNYKF